MSKVNEQNTKVNRFEPIFPDPWDHKGIVIGALIMWIVIFGSLIAGAILLENHGLSTICALVACKVFFTQITDRIEGIREAWKLHVKMTGTQL